MAEKLYAGHTFEETVRLYADTVTGVCVMRLRNSTDAEDCFQNVFCKLYSKSPEFDNDEHLKAWLIRVAINECVSYARKFRMPFISKPPEDNAYYDNTDSMDMSWALMETPLKYRDVLYLYYCEQYKVKEISQILKIKENTVKSLLKRGREVLKSIYGGDDR